MARKLAKRGQQHLAEKQPARAQAELEESREIFTRLLAEYPEPRWTVLKPVAMESRGGATLTRLADGSILAGGTNPDRDMYTVVAKPGLGRITAIRLEVLPDPSLPYHGPGGSPFNGNFNLNELRFFSNSVPVDLTDILVAYDRPRSFETSSTGRSVQGEVGAITPGPAKRTRP